MSTAVLERRVRWETRPAERRIILITSNKGGTGKTTIGINLAAAAAYMGFDVCALDFDTQHNFDHWALRRRRYPALPQVSVYHGMLRNYEAILENAAHHQVTFIDTPPGAAGEDRQAIAALTKAADFILVPTQTSMVDLETTIPWCRQLQAEKTAQGMKNRVAFIINRANMRSIEIRDANSVLVDVGRVCSIHISDRIAFQRVMKSGHSIVDAAENEKGKQDFVDVWKWIEREIEL